MSMQMTSDSTGRHHLIINGEDKGTVSFGHISKIDAQDPYRWSLSDRMGEESIASGKATSISGAIRDMIAVAKDNATVLDVTMRISHNTVADYDSAEIAPMSEPRTGSTTILISDDPGLPGRAANVLMSH